MRSTEMVVPILPLNLTVSMIYTTYPFVTPKHKQIDGIRRLHIDLIIGPGH